MEFDKLCGKSKKGLITKTWKRCTSFGSFGRKNNQHSPSIKSKSWTEGLSTGTGKKNRVVPEGCFSVYVGHQRQRFVIRTKYLNHPLFRMLLEEAESEFGYSSEGPLFLPCDVDIFEKLLMEMDDSDELDHRSGCSFAAKTHDSYYRLLSPTTSAFNKFSF
ncbi:protein SMALL AUXIN UP-REGULATED RNA 51-like [Lycium barbarum]|uniref:protein SMALL AUXIN UP-REGULATED RNA 51-like n=1 Tax=Lycium barbarum TaxID=112863 RepID=UPI00293E4AB8|nr:protein SMALL AUXIN UP-REGULATED RNA 51-like [Lycium barbarum]